MSNRESSITWDATKCKVCGKPSYSSPCPDCASKTAIASETQGASSTPVNPVNPVNPVKTQEASLKALSLHQPWAFLMAMEAKCVETRSWRTNYRGPVCIHASAGKPPGFSRYKTYPYFEAYWPETFHFGCIIAIGDLVECVPAAEMSTRLLGDVAAGSRRASEELAFGNYTFGRWAWRFESIRQINPAIPVRGSLGLWTVPNSVLSTINYQPTTTP